MAESIEERETRTTSDGEPRADAERGDDRRQPPTPPASRSRWEQYRAQIVGGVAVVLIAGALSLIADWVVGAADAVRDVARQVIDYDAGELDSFKERIEDRPWWGGDPVFLDDSFDYLHEYERGGPYLLGSNYGPEAVSVDELTRAGHDYDGEPVVVVGRVTDVVSLPQPDEDRIFAADGTREVTLAGADPRRTIRAGNGPGLSGGSLGSPGDVVALGGVVGAVGPIKVTGQPVPAETVYFVVQDVFKASHRGFREHVGRLRK